MGRPFIEAHPCWLGCTFRFPESEFYPPAESEETESGRFRPCSGGILAKTGRIDGCKKASGILKFRYFIPSVRRLLVAGSITRHIYILSTAHYLCPMN